MSIDLVNFSTRTRTDIKRIDNISTWNISSKDEHLYSLKNAFQDELKKNPTQTETIKNTFLLAIKIYQESVNHEGRSYFTNQNHYGDIDDQLLKVLLDNHKQQFEEIVVHRYAIGNTKRNFTSLFNSNNTNYTEHAILLRDFIKAHRFITYTYPNRYKYEGIYVTGRGHGHGVYTYANGDKYEGSHVNGERQSNGIYTWVGGKKYVGDWVNHKMEGYGTLICPADREKYEGRWVNSKRHGHGISTYADGSKYDGEWLEDKRHGHGTLTYPDGRKYEGNWVDGQKHGYGTLTYPDGRKYVGDWVNGEQEGHGTYTWPDGDTYEGRWVNGEKEGYGTRTRQDGSKHEGSWAKNVPQIYYSEYVFCYNKSKMGDNECIITHENLKDSDMVYAVKDGENIHYYLKEALNTWIAEKNDIRTDNPITGRQIAFIKVNDLLNMFN